MTFSLLTLGTTRVICIGKEKKKVGDRGLADEAVIEEGSSRRLNASLCRSEPEAMKVKKKGRRAHGAVNVKRS